jgi:hypothetical protein
MLWVVVLSACLSMYEYFRAFYRVVMERAAEEAGSTTPKQSPQVAALPLPPRSVQHKN